MDIINSFGFSFGGFGELLQGVLPNDKHFLITLPINLKSKATFKFNGNNKFTIYPTCKEKVRIFCEMLSSYYRLPIKGDIIIESDIPIGKGLSSSTADIVATYRALSQGFDLKYSPVCAEKLMSQIEPSDGLLYDGVVAYYHKEVSLLNQFNYYPDLVIAAIDEGGIVDTLKYNQIRRDFSMLEKYEFEKLLEKFVQAVEMENIKLIGDISTRSTELNQKYNYKPSFFDLLKINLEIDGLGIICAHSGTYIGILLNKLDPMLSYKINYCSNSFNRLNKRLELFYTNSELNIPWQAQATGI